MSKKELGNTKIIRQIVFTINRHWLNKQCDEIGKFLSEKVVIAPPGSDKRIRGRDAYVQSYRDYDQSAITHKFSPDEPEIDIIGETAVAVYPFYVEYELQGKTYREHGKDILVFSNKSGEWKVVWRTMQSEPVK